MHKGFILLFRKFMECGWYQSSELVYLFIHLILRANYEERMWRGQQNRITFITTNLKASDVTERYGARVKDGIKVSMNVLKLLGPSRRK